VRNSDRFLVAFNSIEKALRQDIKDEHYIPFSRLITLAKKTNAIVRMFYDDLREYSDLRNAIVHDTIDLNYAIAEPHDSIVDNIEKIALEITKPKKVIPLFEKKVKTFQSNNSLADILRAINKFSYSKFPIYEGDKFIGLLTKKGIVNWLAIHVDDPDLSFTNTILKDVIWHEKKKKNYRFIHKDMTIYDVKEIFKKNVEEGSTRIDAILISEYGGHSNHIYGIITPWDMVHIT